MPRLTEPPKIGDTVWMEANVLPGQVEVVGPFEVQDVLPTGHSSSAEWLVRLSEVSGRYPYRMFFSPPPLAKRKA